MEATAKKDSATFGASRTREHQVEREAREERANAPSATGGNVDPAPERPR